MKHSHSCTLLTKMMIASWLTIVPLVTGIAHAGSSYPKTPTTSSQSYSLNKHLYSSSTNSVVVDTRFGDDAQLIGEPLASVPIVKNCGQLDGSNPYAVSFKIISNEDWQVTEIDCDEPKHSGGADVQLESKDGLKQTQHFNSKGVLRWMFTSEIDDGIIKYFGSVAYDEDGVLIHEKDQYFSCEKTSCTVTITHQQTPHCQDGTCTIINEKTVAQYQCNGSTSSCGKDAVKSMHMVTTTTCESEGKNCKTATTQTSDQNLPALFVHAKGGK